jgi:hypothetical protein
MRRLVALVAIGFVLATGPAAFGQVIFDNGSTVANPNALGIVTDPGAGAGGFDASVLQNVAGTNPADTIFGFGHQNAVRLAENFTVPAGQVWTINSVVTFGYLTGATTPTATGGTVRFWSGGAPNAGGTVIAGDTTTNVLAAGSNQFLNIYRTLTTDIGTATNRRIQSMTLTLAAPLVLSEGTYWLDYNSTGTGFVPPLQVVPRESGIVTGDALQSLDSGATWANVLDGAAQKGIPFQLVGSVVPEPTSIALVSVGAIGLGLRRLRKKS